MTADINPKIVDGEPMCYQQARRDCPYYEECQAPLGNCIPGLRQQRDAAIERAEKAEMVNVRLKREREILAHLITECPPGGTSGRPCEGAGEYDCAACAIAYARAEAEHGASTDDDE